jgi:hypothetical protein
MLISALEMRLTVQGCCYRSQEQEDAVRIGKRYHQRNDVYCKQIVESEEHHHYDF